MIIGNKVRKVKMYGDKQVRNKSIKPTKFY